MQAFFSGVIHPIQKPHEIPYLPRVTRFLQSWIRELDDGPGHTIHRTTEQHYGLCNVRPRNLSTLQGISRAHIPKISILSIRRLSCKQHVSSILGKTLDWKSARSILLVRGRRKKNLRNRLFWKAAVGAASVVAEPEAEADTEEHSDADAEAGPEADAEADAGGHTDDDTGADVEVDAEADAEADAVADAEADAETDAEADAETDAEADAETDVEADAGADSEADTEADTGAEADVETGLLVELGLRVFTFTSSEVSKVRRA